MRKVVSLVLIASLLLVIGIFGAILTIPTLNSDDLTVEEKVISEPISNITINTTNTKVIFVPTNELNIKVQLNHYDGEEKLSVNIADKTLDIQVKEKFFNYFNINFFKKASSLIIYVPNHDYETLTVKNKNGAIEMDSLNASKIDAKTNNGKIMMESIISDEIKINTNNGRIELKNISANEVNFHADNGSVSLHYVEGKVVGKTSNGRITYHTTELNNSISLTTSNGRINVITEKDLENVTFDLRTGNGRIRVFEQADWDSVIGNGENIIKLRTDNGGITINHPE